MPYDTTAELPERVRDDLPEDAQELFREAYNSAYEEYQSPEERWNDDSREETARRVAWEVVEEEYEKVGEEWVRK